MSEKLCAGCNTAPAIKRYSRGQRKWSFYRCLDCARKEVAASRKRLRDEQAKWERFLNEWKVGA